MSYTGKGHFFHCNLFAGERASDIGKVVTQEVRRLSDDDGFLFRHMVGKTLGNGRVNTFAIRRVANPVLYSVLALDNYVGAGQSMGVNLSEGYLFRPVDRALESVLETRMSYSVVYERLKTYLGALGIDEGILPIASDEAVPSLYPFLGQLLRQRGL